MSDKGGRPQVVIEYETLKALCRIQCTGEEIASVLGICYDTLNTALIRDGHGGFSEYYKKASASGRQSLRRVQYTAALNGSIPMMIWLGKQYLGQSDKSDNTHNINAVDAIKDLMGEIETDASSDVTPES